MYRQDSDTYVTFPAPLCYTVSRLSLLVDYGMIDYKCQKRIYDIFYLQEHVPMINWLL